MIRRDNCKVAAYVLSEFSGDLVAFLINQIYYKNMNDEFTFYTIQFSHLITLVNSREAFLLDVKAFSSMITLKTATVLLHHPSLPNINSAGYKFARVRYNPRSLAETSN